jgi:hypothetical protein
MIDLVLFLYKNLGLHCCVDAFCVGFLECVLQESWNASKSLVGVFVLRINTDGHSSVVQQEAVLLMSCMSFLVLVRGMRVLWRARKCKLWETITQLTLMGIGLALWKDLDNHRWPTPGLYLLFLYGVIACWDLKAAEAGVFAPSKTEASPVLPDESSPVLEDVSTHCEAQASPVLEDMSALKNLKRSQLQALAKANNVKANQKNTVIITELLLARVNCSSFSICQ